MAMTLRTDEELDRALEDLASSQGISKQEAARRAILDMHSRLDLRERLDTIADEMLEKWGDVLDRLGKA
ncbi:CopG family transcriptional regulator [Nocardioides ferulae]|uniref:CopG family transcriptional regulator n=1 Tax=Nocardioides ferulae TaxID=2340821 RepID=UPI000EAD5DB0|nr:CopG family transcriptional regulator [Nocardioides ferulae]